LLRKLVEVFTIDVLKGDPENSIKRAFSVMLARSARKFFGSEDPMNKY